MEANEKRKLNNVKLCSEYCDVCHENPNPMECFFGYIEPMEVHPINEVTPNGFCPITIILN